MLINQHPICDFGQDVISYSQHIDMDQHSMKNVLSPVNKFDALNKAYADRINIKQLVVIFPILLGQK